MKINLQTGLASHSAAAKTPAKLISFLQAVFNLKAPAATKIADSIVHISKEKALVTPAIDAFLDFAKTAKQPEIDKAIKSKTVQNLKPVLAATVKNKTFAGTIAAIKKFKFKAPSVKAPASANLKDELTGLESPDFSKMTPIKAVNYFYKQLLSKQTASELLDVLVFAKEIENEYDQFDNADSIFFTVLEKFLKKYGLKSDLVSIGQLNKNSLLFMLDEDTEDLVRIVRKGTSVVLKNSETGKTSTAKSMADYIEALKVVAPVSSTEGKRVDRETYESKYKIPLGLTVLPENEFFGGSAAGFVVGVSRNQLIELFDQPYKDPDGDEWRIGYKRQPFALYSSDFKAPTDPDAPHVFSIRSKDTELYRYGTPKLAMTLVEDGLGMGTFARDVSEATKALKALNVKVKAGRSREDDMLAKMDSEKSQTPQALVDRLSKPTTAAKSLPYKTIQKLAEALFDVNDADEDFGVKERTKWFNSKYGTNFKSIIIEHSEADDVPVIDFITKSNVRTRMFSVAYAKRLARSLGLSGTQNDIGLVTIVRNKPVKNTARVNPLFASAMREVMIMS